MSDNPVQSLLRRGDRIVCLGDSITADPEGYVTMVREVLRLSRPDAGIEVINAGADGNTAADMLARFERDVITARPAWVTISAGSNDALRSVGVKEYGEAITSMVEVAEAARIRVGLCTPTLFEAHLAGASAEVLNTTLKQYCSWLETTAEERGLLLIPMFEMCRLVHENMEPDNELRLTYDGVHMSPVGRYLMGLTFLAAFGVSLRDPGNKVSIS